MLGHESGKMLIQHYRELVKPKDAARYFSIRPASEAAGKVLSGRCGLNSAHWLPISRVTAKYFHGINGH